MIQIHPTVEVEDAATDGTGNGPARPDVALLEVQWGRLSEPLDLTSVVDGARVHLTVRVPVDATFGWPSGTQIASLIAAGVTGVTLHDAGTVSPAAAVHLVAFLAEAFSHGLRVTWALDAGPDGDEQWPFVTEYGDLVHLPPPGGSGARARAWRDQHSYGQFYWRHGGGFALVTDLRAHDPARYTIDEDELLAVFADGDQAASIAELPAEAHEHLEVLQDARLVYVADGWVARLPYRLRRWPTPLKAFI